MDQMDRRLVVLTALQFALNNSGCRRTNRLNARLNDDAKTTVITCVTHPLFE
ncbi:MAG: hypothetical protein RMY33_002355 [Nostoc sp. DedQUE03]|nr:hypothetical protein [Nostoc sp. DedQUE03]MDZ8049568.1 hypothetical protein [Nostoc sp. DedQUE02]